MEYKRWLYTICLISDTIWCCCFFTKTRRSHRWRTIELDFKTYQRHLDEHSRKKCFYLSAIHRMDVPMFSVNLLSFPQYLHIYHSTAKRKKNHKRQAKWQQQSSCAMGERQKATNAIKSLWRDAGKLIEWKESDRAEERDCTHHWIRMIKQIEDKSCTVWIALKLSCGLFMLYLDGIACIYVHGATHAGNSTKEWEWQQYIERLRVVGNVKWDKATGERMQTKTEDKKWGKKLR